MHDLNPTAASILGFLQQGPMTGWDLAQVVDGSIGQFWNVTRSQIYRELKTLDENGLVDMGETGPRERRPYSTTDAGREAFGRWIAREPAPEIIRFPLLLTVFFGAHLEGRHLDRFLRIHRLRHEQRLELYRSMLDGLTAGSAFAVHTLRFGLLYEEAVLRWFDSLPSFAAGPTATRPSRIPSTARRKKRSRRHGPPAKRTTRGSI